MNNFGTYINHYRTPVVSRNVSPTLIRKDFTFSPQFSPHQPKYKQQFKCLDEKKAKPNQFPVSKQSPGIRQIQQPKILPTIQIDKENMHSLINQQIKTPRDNGQKSFLSTNTKQPTPCFEKTGCESMRYCDSHITDESTYIMNFADQINKITIKDSQKSEDFLVQMDSVKKREPSTKNIAIQAFESQQFKEQSLQQTAEQLEKIFGSIKKVKLVKKKPSQLQTQKTEFDESKKDSEQLKTINDLSRIEYQSEPVVTQLTLRTQLDSVRDDESEVQSHRSNLPTPRHQHQKKISFLMYKKQAERRI
ncbi:hypothetical protein pb186bvf_017625 [Paramecium bursaria]